MKPPPIRIKTTAIVKIMFSCVQDADDMIADLREARKKAKKTGGAHYVYRTDPKTGDKFLIELSFPHLECG